MGYTPTVLPDQVFQRSPQPAYGSAVIVQWLAITMDTTQSTAPPQSSELTLTRLDSRFASEWETDHLPLS